MKLSTIKTILPALQNVEFQTPDGSFVPEHFHVTEVGRIQKFFIDCGGTVRKETVISFQLWNASDFEHRLKPEKLLRIIKHAEEKLGIEDGRSKSNTREKPSENMGWISMENTLCSFRKQLRV